MYYCTAGQKDIFHKYFLSLPFLTVRNTLLPPLSLSSFAIGRKISNYDSSHYLPTNPSLFTFWPHHQMKMGEEKKLI